jgi:hypothetical protein
VNHGGRQRTPRPDDRTRPHRRPERHGRAERLTDAGMGKADAREETSTKVSTTSDGNAQHNISHERSDWAAELIVLMGRRASARPK